MDSLATVAIGFLFRDRDANEGKITMYLPFSVPIADAFAWAYSMAEQLQLLSNAVLQRVEITYRWREALPPAGAIESNIRHMLLLFYRGPDELINTIAIPSPRGDIFEQSGPYAAIRADATHAAILALTEALELFPLVTVDDRAFGSLFLAGGLAL